MTADLEPEAKVELRRQVKAWTWGGFVLAAIVGLFVWWIVTDANRREQDRLIARYVLCTELDSLKKAQREDLQEKIDDGETFLRANPRGLPLPGLGTREIRRSIDRQRALKRKLAPYPRGCAAFARDPARLNVHVPTIQEEP